MRIREQQQCDPHQHTVTATGADAFDGGAAGAGFFLCFSVFDWKEYEVMAQSKATIKITENTQACSRQMEKHSHLRKPMICKHGRPSIAQTMETCNIEQGWPHILFAMASHALKPHTLLEKRCPNHKRNAMTKKPTDQIFSTGWSDVMCRQLECTPECSQIPLHHEMRLPTAKRRHHSKRRMLEGFPSCLSVRCV